MGLNAAVERSNEMASKVGSFREKSFMSCDSWRVPFVLLLATFLLWFMYMVGSPLIENHCSFVAEEVDFTPFKDPSSVSDSDGTTAVSSPECNIWMGRWIRDMSYPVRKNSTCACLNHSFDCKERGRVDDDYMHYRWQPFDCDIPRFNAEDFLERMRGKKIVFVGDSLNRNHFVSLVCLLGDAVPIDTIKLVIISKLFKKFFRGIHELWIAALLWTPFLIVLLLFLLHLLHLQFLFPAMSPQSSSNFISFAFASSSIASVVDACNIETRWHPYFCVLL